MKKIISLIFCVLLLGNTLWAEEIIIFAASDLRFALDELKNEFLKQNPNNKIHMIYGSSGKGMHQIENGAPYHLFFSANMDFIQKLYDKGEIVTRPNLYAFGRIVIWSKNKNFKSELGFENLTASWVNKIAIANPTHAPYGEKAKQALKKAGIYTALESKLVFGENISQTAGFISSEAADIGIIALSLILRPTIEETKPNSYYLIDTNMHEPLAQGYGLTKYGSKSELANSFYKFIGSIKAVTIMQKYGFTTR